ncbi:MAG: hypothetical protein DRI69_04335 [Bacteroidetes bacterium]|nr:MAG: hypothetical protein DRI69_04335 [Bacteroidota bacterium]
MIKITTMERSKCLFIQEVLSLRTEVTNTELPCVVHVRTGDNKSEQMTKDSKWRIRIIGYELNWDK